MYAAVTVSRLTADDNQKAISLCCWTLHLSLVSGDLTEVQYILALHLAIRVWLKGQNCIFDENGVVSIRAWSH